MEKTPTAANPPAAAPPRLHFLQRILDHPVGALALVLVVAALGVVAFWRLPTNLMPDIVYPMVRVQVRAGQTPPDILVNTVTRVLEQQVAQAEGVELIESATTQGQVQISLSFNYQQDIDAALRDVSALVDRARAQLPGDLEPPIIFKFDPQNLPVLELIMTSATLDPTALRQFADKDLVYRFGGIAGVSVVRPAGGQVREVQVQARPAQLRRYGLTLQNLSDALATGTAQQAAGRVDVAGREHYTLATALAGSVAALGNRALPTPGGGLVRLRDVASVTDSHQEQRIVVTVNGREGVKLSFFKNPQANSVAVARAINAQLKTLLASGTLPPGIQLAVTSNESSYIVNSIGSAQHALLLAVALVALVVLLFLKDVRLTLLSLSVLPVALLATLLLMEAFGLSLNLMSIGGLIVGVSLLIDYGIVFLENIHRHWQQHGQVRQAVGEAAREVAVPLVASLLALVAVVLPFLLFGGISLLFFREFILVVIFATVSGLVVAFVLIPTLYSFIGRGAHRGGEETGEKDTGAAEPHAGLQLDGLIRWQQRGLAGGLRQGRWVVAGAALGLVLTVWLALRLGNTFLPEIDDGRITLQIQAEPGTLLADFRRQVGRIEALLLRQPDVVLVDATAGGRIGQTIQETPAEAEVLVALRPKNARAASVQDAIGTLSDQIAGLHLPGVKTKVKKARIRAIRTFSGNASSGDFDVVVNVEGQDPAQLTQLGEQVRGRLRRVTGLADVRTTLVLNQPTLRVNVDADRAASYGVTPEQVTQTLATAIGGTVPARYLEKGEYYGIRLQLDRAAVHGNLQGLPTLPVQRLPTGDLLLLGQVADLQLTKGPLALDRVNQATVNMVNASARGRALGDVAGDVHAALDTMRLPAGYRLSYGGRLATLESGGGGLVWVGLFGLALLLVVLAVLYESLATPLLIVGILPLGLLGSVGALTLAGLPLSATALIGFILVIGIATNNALVLVAFIEQLRREGHSVGEAVRVGTALRLQPKLMTALIAMAGMVPLAIGREEGGEILQPLALVILGGMPVALVATLLVLPVLYALVHGRREAVAAAAPAPAA